MYMAVLLKGPNMELLHLIPYFISVSYNYKSSISHRTMDVSTMSNRTECLLKEKQIFIPYPRRNFIAFEKKY